MLHSSFLLVLVALARFGQKSLKMRLLIDHALAKTHFTSANFRQSEAEGPFHRGSLIMGRQSRPCIDAMNMRFSRSNQ
jgi:hypothetical protein